MRDHNDRVIRESSYPGDPPEPDEGGGLELVMLPCPGCGESYVTTAEPGEKTCPIRGHAAELGLLDLNDYLRPEVQTFAMAMEDRLRANDHKGGWDNEFPQRLIERCREELGELDVAIDEIRANGPNEERLASVLMEAADVGNFAMMVEDVVRNWPGGGVR